MAGCGQEQIVSRSPALDGAREWNRYSSADNGSLDSQQIMNPYAPPKSNVDIAQDQKRTIFGWMILALSVLQMLWLLLNIPGHIELVRTGAVSAVAGILGLAGCLSLYIGAVRFASNRHHGRRVFFVALMLLLFSLRGWGVTYFWSYPYIFGTAIAALGFVLTSFVGRATQTGSTVARRDPT